MLDAIPFSPSDVLALQRLGKDTHFGCTSLTYRDLNEAVYLGRTLELTMDLPYQLAYFPAGHNLESKLGRSPAVQYSTQFPVLGIVMPDRIPTAAEPITVADLKVMEGLNSQGLTFSLLAYPSSGIPANQAENTRAILAATDLGTWTLGQFATVAEVQAALDAQPISLDAVPLLGGVNAPFHYVLHDRTGQSIVIEFENGAPRVFDNPVGVMTNGPQFSWHLTNLNNYTHLTNRDHSVGMFGNLRVQQPDSGIATANLPPSDTSVGRFVRAAYYAQFAEKVSDPDEAICTLAHIMNQFDRTKGISTSSRSQSAHMEVEGMETPDASEITEFTSWINLTDLNRNRFYLRTYDALNYTAFDLNQLAETNRFRLVGICRFNGLATDGTSVLLAGHPESH